MVVLYLQNKVTRYQLFEAIDNLFFGQTYRRQEKSLQFKKKSCLTCVYRVIVSKVKEVSETF